MKRQTTLTLCIVAVAFSATATFSFLPDYLTKKMEKCLTKLFDKNVEYRAVETDDLYAINHQVYTVHQGDSLSGYSILSRGLGCKIGGCDKPSTTDTVTFEQFYYMTAFDANKKVKRVRVLEYTSDHGYQIGGRGWLKQFENGDHFTVGENIDAISGATISVKSITNGINTQVEILQKNL